MGKYVFVNALLLFLFTSITRDARRDRVLSAHGVLKLKKNLGCGKKTSDACCQRELLGTLEFVRFGSLL